MIRQVKAKPKTSLTRDQKPSSTGGDDYKGRLIKMIPGDVVAAYLACNTALSYAVKDKVLNDYIHLFWIVLGLMLVLLPVYLIRVMKVTEVFQIVIMCVAFLLWTTTINQPYGSLFATDPDGETKRQLYSTLALTFFTFAVPLLYKGEPSPDPDPVAPEGQKQ